MKKHKNKVIIGVAILLVLTVILSLSNNKTQKTVTQDKKEYYENTTCVAEDLFDKYDPQLKDNKDGTYTISIGSSYSSDEVDNVIKTASFKVTEITGGAASTAVESLSSISYEQPLVIGITPTTDSVGGYTLQVKIQLIDSTDGCKDSGFTATLTIEKQGNAISGSANTKANTNIGAGKICDNFKNGIYDANQFNNGTVTIKKADFDAYNYASVNAEGKNFYEELLNYCWQDQVIIDYSEKEIGQRISNAIAIWKNYSSPNHSTLSVNFTDIKNKAAANGNVQDNPATLALDYSLKCSHKVDDNATDYYQNKSYYYAKKSEATKQVTYTYNHSYGGTQTTETKDVCTRTCEEAVMVEYGPPVATKAGLCFEYKVKVTSYVKCDSEINLDSKPTLPNYCTPAPVCVHNDKVIRQAGPSEEFDSCIESCDGGKYTAACSQKCYDKVYKSNKSLNNLSLTTDYQVLPLAYTKYCNQADGCYYRNGDTIKWQSPTQDKQTFGRWYFSSGYCTNEEDCKTSDNNSKEYFADSDGIKRAINSDGNPCQDVCHWEGCTKEEYLNEQDVKDDYIANEKLYNTAVSECKALASCSTKTAEFTISIKYDTKDSEGTTKVNKLEFPYSTESDKLKAQGGNSLADNTTILNYDGCYEDKDQYNWYQTEWSFPGSYINNKTGEISYEDKTGNKAWHKEKGKFCMPLNAQSVNKKWWEWKVLGNNCYTEAEILEELNGITGTSNGYNIEAIAKDFGYFGWNFNIKCFYAMRNEVCDTSATSETTGKVCCDPDSKKETGLNYTVRSIDRENLFPNSEYNVVDTTKARKIGFNWTEDASILSLKNTNYYVNPTQLIEDIQTTANEIYNGGTYLDYQFYLTPTSLNQIRKYNDKYDYGTWNGSIKEINGINVYSSNLFRSTGSESVLTNITGAVKKTGTVGVNNEG